MLLYWLFKFLPKIFFEKKLKTWWHSKSQYFIKLAFGHKFWIIEDLSSNFCLAIEISLDFENAIFKYFQLKCMFKLKFWSFTVELCGQMEN